MQQKYPITPSMPNFVVLGERTFAEWDERSIQDNGELGPTFAQELEAKANASGAQGAFFSRKPEFLSPEAHRYNVALAEIKGGRIRTSTKAIVALVARIHPEEQPPINWRLPETT